MAQLKIIECPALKKVSMCELQEIVTNIEICKNDKCEEVYFSKFPPANVCLPWQEQDTCGGNIGAIKYYKDGAWI